MSDPAAELVEVKERLRLGRRRAAVISIVAAPAMISWGVVLLLILPLPGAGVFCIAFGAVGGVVWLVLWPWGARHGRV